MNTGLVSSRYAKALLMLCEKRGSGEAVYETVLALLKDAASVKTLPQELEQFIQFLVQKGRLNDLKFIFTSFVSQYRASRKIYTGSLTTAVPMEGLASSIEKVLLDKSDAASVQLETDVDPSLIGGFVLEVNNRRLDASVRTQLDNICRQMAENKA